ncbi:MAG: hypothetical protein A2V69_02150 [Candidatus Portnoybacteria bacterium RBG_13_40_8]|uniref:DUF763 domain-containing protein n=1 Tax=Candidatus Portnoybacteria bacterium RBG_13_40_8 TaxID=1801990 RepID=A0A1G2F348_9BACT|nr:MAG: hypothetical protein A2V69_02150 [Candidatus Portnoybacteria bacterium RBG_13_40_8]
MRTGLASFPLDYGTCPRWLFERMTRLSRSIVQAIVSEFGAEEFLKRLSDPVWFQSFGSVLAFDWNSSGLTTTTCGALKMGIWGLEKDLGLFICGGKGKTSRKTPNQIIDWADRLNFSQNLADKLVYSSKISAKVDNTAIQDGFQLYHHTFLFTKKGNWAVVQQGMNEQVGQARRYHWLSENVNDYIEEPHTGISSNIKVKPLNLTAKQSKKNKEISTELVKGGYKALLSDLELIREKQTGQKNLFRTLEMPDDTVLPQLTGDLDFGKNKYLGKILFQVHEKSPQNFEQLLMSEGVGPMTIRALSLVSELIYGAKPSYEDPARYSFAFGGKDGVPFPVNRPVYDKTLDVIEKGIKKAQISYGEKEKALRRFTESSGA